MSKRKAGFAWAKGLAMLGVVTILLAGTVACSALIPTAQTAPVEPLASTESTAAASGVPSATATGAITPPSAYTPPAEVDPQEAPVTLIAATVVRIVDGDTAVFKLEGGAQEKVRFIGVDTPESTTRIEPYGKAASAYTARRLKLGSKVYLEKDVEPRDRYGRLLAYIWLKPPTAINESEIRAKLFNAQLAIDGYAQQMTIPPNVKYATYFGTFADEARFEGKGLWGDDGGSSSSGAVAPVAAPAPSKSTSSGSYIGNRNTMKFHIPSCSSVGQMNPGNKVALTSRDQAISKGYVPCKRCNP